MPRNNNKDSQSQDSDEDREIGSRHEQEVDDSQLDERVPQKAGIGKLNEETLDDDDDIDDENDLDDLSAMEGPDA
jgi:hypothetical protein